MPRAALFSARLVVLVSRRPNRQPDQRYLSQDQGTGEIYDFLSVLASSNRMPRAALFSARLVVLASRRPNRQPDQRYLSQHQGTGEGIFAFDKMPQ